MTGKSTQKSPSRKAAIDRPPKPYKDFPLGPANNGCWQKKIRGKIHYFGHWGRVVKGKMERLPDDGWEAALALYKTQANDLHAGRTPSPTGGEGLTVKGLCNRFLTSKLRNLERGKITPLTFRAYRAVTDRLIATFSKSRLVDDLRPNDFETLIAGMRKNWGPVRLGSEVVRTKTVFKYAIDNRLIDKAVHYGTEFKKPSKTVIRKHRAASGPKLFDASEILALLDVASPQLRAMVLLAINAGFGNADCGSLPLSAIDLDGGRISYPRPKTGVERRCPLWPVTIKALREALAERPAHATKADADIAFVTKYGNRWVRAVLKERTDSGPKHTPIDSIGLEFGKLLRHLKLKRKGVSFYALQHTFRTVADATLDFPAVRLIMGHADGSIDDIYREQIDNNRLVSVTNFVHSWLFGTERGEV